LTQSVSLLAIGEMRDREHTLCLPRLIRDWFSRRRCLCIIFAIALDNDENLGVWTLFFGRDISNLASIASGDRSPRNTLWTWADIPESSHQDRSGLPYSLSRS